MKAKLNLWMMRVWHELKGDEAQDLIEYALLVGFISLAVVASMKPFGDIIYHYYLIMKSNIDSNLALH
ncbi:MAG: Flp family type IVb pilin [Acidobacteriaceae bacterium]